MLVWPLFDEQPLRAPGEFEEAYAFVQVTLVCRLMQVDFLHQFLLLDAPLFRHLDVEGAVYAAIELVDVHCVNAVLESLDLGLQTDDSGLMLLALIRVALTQGSADPLQYLLAEVQLAEDLGKFLGDDLFPHVGLAAFPLVAGAVVIDIAALLKFPHHGAATMPTIDKARKGEIALAALELARVAGVEDALDALPELSGDEGLIFASRRAALARIEVDLRGWPRRPGFGIRGAICSHSSSFRSDTA